MARAERRADVVWEGNLVQGHGKIVGVGSGALGELPISMWAMDLPIIPRPIKPIVPSIVIILSSVHSHNSGPTCYKVWSCDGTLRGRRNQRSVFGEDTARVAWGRFPPIRQAGSNFSVRKFDIEMARFDVDGDNVSSLQCGKRATICRFGGDMTNHQSASGPTEATVRD